MSITILDGGMGQELIKRSSDPPTPLWSTRVMIDYPHLVRAVHDDFFAAGADVATANTYAILHDRLQKHGLDHRFRELHETGCNLANEARDAHGGGRVAGSLGPIGWSYRADMAPPPDEAAGIYAEIVAIQAPLVDLFLCETMSGVDQAQGAVMGAKTGGKPVWLAISVSDEDGTNFRSGEPVTDILPVVDALAPEALLVNCSTPEAVSQALPLLAPHGIPLGAYANGFTGISGAFAKGTTSVDLLTSRQDFTPALYADFAEQWAEMGAEIIGGCCEVGPAHIAELKRRFT
ncbi:MAG: homocysteine S-methyltransferase family protein [Rhodobacter sp.]|nr:homocysteine S-methyltransferase family protein [Rhodobacter sp.]